MENERILKAKDNILKVVDEKVIVEGTGSVSDLVSAAEMIDPKFDRAFLFKSNSIFGEDSETIKKPNGLKVDGFGLFEHLEYITYLALTVNDEKVFIEVEGSLMEDTYKLSFFKEKVKRKRPWLY